MPNTNESFDQYVHWDYEAADTTTMRPDSRNDAPEAAGEETSTTMSGFAQTDGSSISLNPLASFDGASGHCSLPPASAIASGISPLQTGDSLWDKDMYLGHPGWRRTTTVDANFGIMARACNNASREAGDLDHIVVPDTIASAISSGSATGAVLPAGATSDIELDLVPKETGQNQAQSVAHVEQHVNGPRPPFRVKSSVPHYSPFWRPTADQRCVPSSASTPAELTSPIVIGTTKAS